MSANLPPEADSIQFKPLTQDQIDHFNGQGYLILKDIMAGEEAAKLTAWTKEVKETVPARGNGQMPYMEIDKAGRRVLTVTEVYSARSLHPYLNRRLEFLQYTYWFQLPPSLALASPCVIPTHL